MTKTCTKCNIDKELSEFYYRKDSNKYRGECIACHNAHNLLYRESNREELLAKKRAANVIYRKTDRYKELDAGYRKDSTYKARRKIAVKKYYDNNKKKIFAKEKIRAATDPDFKVLHNLRARIRGAIKGNCKGGSTPELLGCSIQEVRKHLESQFTEGMSWDNYGKWHVDHIIPCAAFDLKSPEKQKECFNYTNLQPLWAYDNLCKGAKLTP